jgi:carbamoyltransferase
VNSINAIELDSPVPSIKGGLTVGLSGGMQHGCVALSDGQRILGVCDQERVIRTRAAGFKPSGLPEETVDLLLRRAGRSRADITRYILAGEAGSGEFDSTVRIEQHYSSACASYLSSPFTSAVIVVCDRELPKVSVWRGLGSEITRVEWPWAGPGFSDVYTSCARLLGFPAGGEQRFEALARLNPDHREPCLNSLLETGGGGIALRDGWEARIAELFEPERSLIPARSQLAGALQNRIGELLLAFLTKVRDATRAEHICLGGSLFCNSAINTVVRTSGLFSRVFVPVDPGKAGLAVGAALHDSGRPTRVSPFLGPAYRAAEIKASIESCKLPYTLVTESEAVERAVDALQDGLLVGWYEGAMEWGPRALGARSILANPFAPYILENLNHFLKHREPWRGYALSALEPAAEQYFSGPSESPFMECDFRARDAETFRHVLASPEAGVRVQLVGADAPPSFRNLLAAFGTATGIPCVVNTSFNGFHEPIVCSPRDAIRVFYGTGIDVLFLDRFVITK